MDDQTKRVLEEILGLIGEHADTNITLIVHPDKIERVMHDWPNMGRKKGVIKFSDKEKVEII